MKQYWALLWINLASIPQRLGLVLTIVIGVACAVGVLASMLAMGEGARRQAMGAVRADHLILLSVGAQAPMQSSIPKDVAALIGDLPGIKRNAQGKPIVVAQVLTGRRVAVCRGTDVDSRHGSVCDRAQQGRDGRHASVPA